MKDVPGDLLGSKALQELLNDNGLVCQRAAHIKHRTGRGLFVPWPRPGPALSRSQMLVFQPAL